MLCEAETEAGMDAVKTLEVCIDDGGVEVGRVGESWEASDTEVSAERRVGVPIAFIFALVCGSRVRAGQSMSSSSLLPKQRNNK